MQQMKVSLNLFQFIFIIFLVSTPFAVRSAENDNFRWQDASREIEKLPFKKQFIDSLKQEYKVLPQTSMRSISKSPLCPSETLVYEVSWGPFKAGNVILTTQYDPQTNTIALGGKALSNDFVSAFYRMRDYIISTVDASGLYPIHFEQHLREGKKYKNDGWLLYDNLNGKLYAKEKKFKIVDMPPFTHDYISALYYIRNLKPSPGDTFTMNLYVNSKVHPMQFKCKKKEFIQTDSGKVSCLLLEPKLVGDGKAYNKKDKLEVWLTDDSIPTPILIKSKIKFGTVNAKLIWHNHQISHVASNEQINK